MTADSASSRNADVGREAAGRDPGEDAVARATASGPSAARAASAAVDGDRERAERPAPGPTIVDGARSRAARRTTWKSTPSAGSATIQRSSGSSVTIAATPARRRWSVSRLRNMARMIASPTAASAAATVITKNTITCPSIEPLVRAKATNARLTAFSMSSIAMKMTMTLRRTSTPKAPIANSTARQRRGTRRAASARHGSPASAPSTTAPTIATSSSTEVSSNGSSVGA